MALLFDYILLTSVCFGLAAGLYLGFKSIKLI
jgi:hypothetical protein